MSANGAPPPRTWQQIAQEVMVEKDDKKLTALVEELNRALAEGAEASRKKPPDTPAAKKEAC